MSFAHPTALLWFALAVPIVVFYILKIRLRRIPVSTTLFWGQIFEEKKPRSLWEVLRHLLSLLAQIAILALLVLALAEPFFRRELLEAKRLVLVIDNSASMNANDVAPSRLARAKEEGRAVIDGLRFRDEMAVIAAGTQPQVLCGLTGHQRTLRTALNGVPATDGPTRVAEAVELARRLLVNQKNRQIVVLTDGGFDEAEALAQDPEVQIVSVGKRTGNVGITRFQVRRSLLDPVGYEILAEVRNDSDDPVECRLEMDLNGNVVDVVPLKLAPDGQFRQVFEKTSTEGGTLTARLNRPDALPADNQAWAILPKREPQPVALVTAGNLFLEKVFEANALVKLAVVKEPPKAPPAGTLTVFHRKVPAKLPPGPVLVIEPSGPCDLWQVGETLQNPIVTQQDRDSPLMAHVRLENVLMPEARRLTFPDAVKPHVLASSLEGEPLFLALDRPEGKVLVLTVNLDKGDLPLQTAFPIMVANALSWFAGNKGELHESVATGAVTAWDAPGKAAYTLHAPDGRALPLPADGAHALIGPLDRCGVWTVDHPAAGSSQGEVKPDFLLACNLANPRESDLRPPNEWKSSPSSAHAGFGGRPLWYTLIMAAWVLVGAEWYLYQRRWIS